jgi:hypothetical protein
VGGFAIIASSLGRFDGMVDALLVTKGSVACWCRAPGSARSMDLEASSPLLQPTRQAAQESSDVETADAGKRRQIDDSERIPSSTCAASAEVVSALDVSCR